MEDTIFNGFYDKLPIKERQGRGGVYPYVSADDVTDRMNRLFKGNWSSSVTFQDFIEGQIIIRIRVEAIDPESGLTFYHEGFGGHTPQSTDEAGNGFKSAYSKALVNACRRWGVGLFLSDESGVTSDGAGRPGPAPQAKTTTIPKFNVPSAPVAAKTPVVAETATITQDTPIEQKIPVPPGALPSVPQPTEAPSTAPPPAPVLLPPSPVTPVAVTQAVDKVVSGMPKIPPKSTTILTETTASPAPPVTPGQVIDDDRVSDVQKIAIQSLVDMRGFKYEDMSQGALGKVPDINTLTHDEAVLVIQFGNNLYRESKQR